MKTTTKRPGIRREYKKGWTIKTHSNRGKFAGCVAQVLLEGRYKYVSLEKTEIKAVKRAIAAAHKEGVLDWQKTKRWLDENNIVISFDDVFAGKPPSDNFKGWYVFKRKYVNVVWHAKIGQHADNAKTIGSSAIRKNAIKRAIESAKSTKYYNKVATIQWLKKNGFSELISYA